jgi:hypothetical protein
MKMPARSAASARASTSTAGGIRLRRLVNGPTVVGHRAHGSRPTPLGLRCGHGRIAVVEGLEFEGELEPGPGGGAYVRLPAEVLTALGCGLRFRAHGRLNGVEFRSSTMPIGGGAACLGVHRATREAAGAALGDWVGVVLEPDDEPREITVPPELAAALAADPAAAAAFDRLSATQRREHAGSVTGAKRQDTRERRLARVLDQLRAAARTPPT